jgi:hypothetical protein
MPALCVAPPYAAIAAPASRSLSWGAKAPVLKNEAWSTRPFACAARWWSPPQIVFGVGLLERSDSPRRSPEIMHMANEISRGLYQRSCGFNQRDSQLYSGLHQHI